MSNLLKLIDKNKATILVFSIIFILLFFQHMVIGMYYDDYGNASLSYAYLTEGVQGTNYTISQLFEWANFIYNNWGGRILYAILFIIPLLKYGITTYMLVQTFVIFAIFYMMYKIALSYLKNKNKAYIIPIILFILYSCFDILYLRDGIYWASASILYIWPLLPLFISIYVYNKLCEKIHKKKKISFWYYLLLLITIPLVTLSQEQYGITLIAYFASYIVLTHLKDYKKYLKLDIFVLLLAISTYLILFMAPGNFVRMDQNTEFASLSLIGKMVHNMPGILYSVFFSKTSIYICILCLIVLYMDYILIKSNKINKYLLYIAFIIPILMMILVLLNIIHVLSFVVCLLWFIDVFVISILYFYQKKNLGLIALEISAMASEFCLLVSPTVGGRTTLPFWFIIFTTMLCLIVFILNEKNKVFNTILIIVFTFVGLYGIMNYYMIYVGYRENYTIYKLNDKIYKSYKEGEGKITLYKVKDAHYGSTQSYEEPSMDIWIKEYYDIPQDVTFEWIDIYDEKD